MRQKRSPDYFCRRHFVINKHTQNIPDENIISIQVDGDKNMWIGTNSGLIKFKKDRFKFYNKENSDLPDNHIWSIKTETDKVWVGTKKGVVKITGEEWELYTKKNSSLPSNIITNITKDEYHRIYWNNKRSCFLQRIRVEKVL